MLFLIVLGALSMFLLWLFHKWRQHDAATAYVGGNSSRSQQDGFGGYYAVAASGDGGHSCGHGGGALRDAVMALHREWLQVIWNAAIRRRPMTIFGIDVAVSLARRSHSVGVGSGQCVKVSALRFLPLRVAAC